MRKIVIACAALSALAIVSSGMAYLRGASVTRDTSVPSVAVVPVAFTPVIAPARADTAPAPPLLRRVAELPNVDVKARIVHTVPDDSGTLPAPRVTLSMRDGRIVEPSALGPAPRGRITKAAFNPAQLSGPAQAAGAASLTISGQTIHLFGVRAAATSDQCAQGNGATAPCGDAARRALTARLAGTAVTCTMPAGQERNPGFMCRDTAGVDLGGLLVAEGLARADPTSSYQYLGAEDAARTSRRGLWRYR